MNEPETQIEIAETFAVCDLKSANWAVRKINECRAYVEQVKAWAAIETARAKSDEARLTAHFGAQLQAVAQSELEGAKRKSIALPSGSIGFRKHAETLEVQDEAAAIEWARANCPEAVKITERLTKTELMAHFRENGELPDGCVYVHEGEEFFVRPNTKGEVE